MFWSVNDRVHIMISMWYVVKMFCLQTPPNNNNVLIGQQHRPQTQQNVILFQYTHRVVVRIIRSFVSSIFHIEHIHIITCYRHICPRFRSIKSVDRFFSSGLERTDLKFSKIIWKFIRNLSWSQNVGAISAFERVPASILIINNVESSEPLSQNYLISRISID